MENPNQISGFMFRFPAKTMLFGRAVDEALLNQIKAKAPDPNVFESAPPFVFVAEMSNQQLDSYYTRMDKTSLINFAEDAKAGIAFQDSHDTWRMGLGRSFDGTFDQGQNGARALGNFYVLPDVKFNGGSYQTSSDFIKQVRAGIATDCSIGFYFENTDPNVFAGIRCDICGNDLMSWRDCSHIPGMVEEKVDEAGNITRIVCTGTIMNAHASECSTVYDGATPGAGILKAQQGAEMGRLKPEAARFLEQRYRSIGLKLPDVKTFALGTPEGERTMADDKKEKDEKPVGEPQRSADDVKLFNGIRTLLTGAGYADTVEIADAVRQMADEIKTLRVANEGIPALKNQAADGVSYRKSLIDDLVKEGVRAFGKDFDEEGERKLFEAAALDTIKRKATDYRAVGDKQFAGGRQTSDPEEPEGVRSAVHRVPNSAFA